MRTDGAEQPAAYVNRVDFHDGRQQVSMKGCQMFQTVCNHIMKPVFVTLPVACVECVMPN